METVGKFEFSRKDLIGHGAFAVVFKGRHREKHDWEVAVKCINKKNLSKSQTLLGKEIKILKELKHENIVALLDFQETASSVYLVMEYCNGGDLADYLHSKGTLSEDTIRVFLQQIAGAMQVLHGKGIIHRDLKPQNILLSYPPGRKSHSNNTCIKIADFGFARYLQTNMMAATLCGSPMYMAPEVIMSQHYDAKADLWSIGTIVFQCLTGKAPFQASSPQDLRLFYEKNKNLIPSIPRETSSHLRVLLLALLQRNHKDRMDFDEFFTHPFLESSSSTKKTTPVVTMTCFSSSASASSCSSSSTSHLASPPLSLAEGQPPRPKTLASPTQDAAGFLKDSSGGAGSSKNSSSCDTDDFVMVPAQCPSEAAAFQDSLMNSGSMLASAGLCVQARTPPHSPSYSTSPNPVSKPIECSPSNYGGHHGNRGQSVPIPVPTQVHNYQRMEENLSSPRTDISPRLSSPVHRCGSGGSLGFFRMGPPSPSSHGPHPPNSSTPRRQSIGGAKTLPLIPHAFQSTEPKPAPQQPESGLGTRLHSAPCLLECAGGGGVRQKVRKQHSDPVMTPQPLHPSPRISPLPTILGSPSRTIPPFEFLNSPSGSPNLVTFLTQQGLVLGPAPPELPATAHRTAPRPPYQDPRGVGRSSSASRLTEMLLMAAFGAGGAGGGGGGGGGGGEGGVAAGEPGNSEPVTSARAIDIKAPPGCGGAPGGPAQVVFTVGSPPSSSTPPQTLRHRKYSGSPSSVSPVGSFSRLYAHAGTCVDGLQGSSCPRYGPADPIAANMGGPVSFEAPELPEETLMEQEHTDTLQSLRFTLDFCRCLLEVAGARGSSEADGDRGSGGALDRGNSILQQQSLVADQISSFSREWSYAEQLVLYLKAAELLSSALHMAMEQVKQGKLYPSTTVKQVVRHLNELYKSSVGSCRGLSGRLEHFFSRKHLLMDHVSCIRAERLLFSHTVHMVKAAALDEMFQQGASSAMRYHKALLLMEGLTLLLTEQDDILSVSKCKECIERRLTALQSGLCA
ncbi:serine/threonine-protein kinase ULK1 [Gadus chalcogrammus]|uniref:serine/threonine-protein kinase ULK1 n=1 Tax=Gadus chalcogrammus TaxID=1042646 RepID=UPI0024C21358|nr:serine/threonine-protein kinase ULK1 [Gadus chalcogrammus]